MTTRQDEQTAPAEDSAPVDPTTLRPLATSAATPAIEIAAAAASARAFMDEPRWRDSRFRADVLRAWAGALRTQADPLISDIVTETGKPIAEARIEITAAADSLDHNAGLARYLGGRAGTLGDGAEAHLVREPLGVCLFVVPWNWPVLLLLRDLAPALAAGVTALVKPSPQTTLITRRILDIGVTAGVPADAARLVVGGAAAGERALRHPDVAGVAFTGSTPVGTRIMQIAAERFVRPLLELGGKGIAVIFDDVPDLESTVAELTRAAVITSGQMCMACTRILVQRGTYDRVLTATRDALAARRIGDPRDPGTEIGPLISADHRDRVERLLADARADGATVSGGERVVPDGTSGPFLTPAVVTGVAPTSLIVQEDVFGPVVTVEPFDDEAHALDLANCTRYGLVAAVYTADVDRTWRTARRLRAGTVWINGYNKSYPELPSGGVKASGLGRTRGIEGLEQFTELKNVHFTVGAGRAGG